MKLALGFACAILAAAAVHAAPNLRPATKAEIEAIRLRMQDDLKDADSAKLRKVFADGPTNAVRNVCGEVNAKNSYGAYGGYVKFYTMIAPTTDGKTLSLAVMLDNDDDAAATRACAMYGM